MKNTINWFVQRTLTGEILLREYYKTKKIHEIVPEIKIDVILNKFIIIGFVLFIQILLAGTSCLAQVKNRKNLYPVMAPLNKYLIGDKNTEIALARSAAPPSISDSAEVMILGRTGYTIAAKGTNGFVCIVERSWTVPTDNPEFWNPKVRAPICYNPQAAKTYLPFDLLKTKLVLAGKSKSEIKQAIASAFDKKELPALEPGAMCYMMSKQQYLNDRGKSWHPHLMFYLPDKAEKSWGANMPDSPVLAAYDSQVGATVFMVWVGKWSNGTPAPPLVH
jgi:hypothetical protein